MPINVGALPDARFREEVELYRGLALAPQKYCHEAHTQDVALETEAPTHLPFCFSMK
jgi:hypothetical protein